MPDPNEISRLLRLKKYEQPAPEYFEHLLHDLHRRQRAEMLRQPLWRIVMDRAFGFFGQPRLDHYSYAAATAAAVVVFFGISNFDSHNQSQGSAVATADKAVSTNIRTASSDTRTEHPRYVIDTRPVSYAVNGPFSF